MPSTKSTRKLKTSPRLFKKQVEDQIKAGLYNSFYRPFYPKESEQDTDGWKTVPHIPASSRDYRWCGYNKCPMCTSKGGEEILIDSN